MKRERKEKEHQGRSIPRKCKVPLQSPFKLSLMEKIRGVEGLARENQNRPIYRAHYMHTRRDYVNFPPCHTVSSTFNYLYLLPFNGLIAFLSAIYRRATESFPTVNSFFHPRSLADIAHTFSTQCERTGVNAKGSRPPPPFFSPLDLPNRFSSIQDASTGMPEPQARPKFSDNGDGNK